MQLERTTLRRDKACLSYCDEKQNLTPERFPQKTKLVNVDNLNYKFKNLQTWGKWRLIYVSVWSV